MRGFEGATRVAAFCAALAGCVAGAESSIKTIYIVPSSHYDRGFVLPPNEVPAMAARHINKVIDTAANDPDFRWTIESVWQVLAFLDEERGLGDILTGHPERVDELINLIRSGRVELSTAWGSVHSEFLGAEELNRLCYDFAALRREYAIDSKIAVLNDVPGQPFSLAPVLAGSGVRYLLVGANQFVGGGTSLSPGNIPFYWEGPDGGRVLTWVSQSPRGGYTEGITDFFLDPFTVDPYMRKSAWQIFNPKTPEKTPLDTMQAGMDILLKRFADAGYRWDAALVMHVHDFLDPSTVGNLEKAVRLWNGAHRSPELRVATASEFFRYMEEKYGKALPVIRGEWSGLWSEAKTSSPQISAMARRGHDDVPAAETLWSALAMDRAVPFPAGDVYSLYHLLLHYDEHSGAGNTGWPGLNDRDKLEQQNREYVEALKEVRAQTEDLLRTGMEVASAEEAGAARKSSGGVRTWPLAVWNSLSWARTGVVRTAAPESGTRVIGVRDRRSGQSVPFDIEDGGGLVFVARDVPAVGYATFDVDVERGASSPTLKGEAGVASAQNSRLRVAVGADGDISSIEDLRDKRELVRKGAAVPFNHLLRSEGDQPAPLAMPFGSAVRVKRGRVVTEIEVERAGSAFPRTSIRLYEGVAGVEIHDEIDGGRLPFASIKSGFDVYYFSFPFALDAASLDVHPEEQHGFVTLPKDYLPGARRDAVTSQHVIGLSDAKATVLLAHRQAFHFVFPGYVRTERSKERPAFPAMFTGKWPLPEATLYSRAFRHSSQGDMRLRGITMFPTVEPGLGDRYEFDYAVASGNAKFDPVEAMRFGAEFDTPLRAVYVPFAAAASHSYFAVDQANVRIDTVKLAESTPSAEITPTNLEDSAQGRRFVIRLQEIAGRETPRVEVTVPGRVANAEVVNLTEDRVIREVGAAGKLVVGLRPYETLTVRVEVR